MRSWVAKLSGLIGLCLSGWTTTAVAAPATYAPAVSPTSPGVSPSAVGKVSTLASEPTSVTSNPSMIQLVPRAAIRDA